MRPPIFRGFLDPGEFAVDNFAGNSVCPPVATAIVGANLRGDARAEAA